MALRSPHGSAKERGLPGPRVETTPIDEQPGGIPAPARPDPSAGRREGGLFDAGNPWAEIGGRKRAEKARYATILADTLGLGEIGPILRPEILEEGQHFVRTKLAWIASIAGGEVGPGPASMVQSAALDLMASRYWYSEWTRTGDGAASDRGSKHAQASGQRLSAARDMATRDAECRAAAKAQEPFDAGAELEKYNAARRAQIEAAAEKEDE